MLRPLIAILCALCLAAAAPAQDSTPPKPQVPLIQQANDALASGDYAGALKILTTLNTQSPNSPQVLYNLGLTTEALAETATPPGSTPVSPCQTTNSAAGNLTASPAEPCYRAAIAADAAFAQPHVALGLLLARAAHLAEARAELNSAMAVPSLTGALKARAERALARLDLSGDAAHSLPPNPVTASADLLVALQLSPEQPEDILLSAQIAEATPDLPAAATAYRRYLALPDNAGEPAATAALAHILLKQSNYADAEAVLTPAVAAHPDDLALSAQLAEAWLDSGDPQKAARATPFVESLHAKNPNNAVLTRLLARIYVETNHPDQADPLFASLIALDALHPDPTLLAARADVLLRLHRPAEAEKLLQQALANPHSFPDPADLADAAAHLAFAASEIDDPRTALQALAISAKLQPPSPPLLFLEATSRDALHQTAPAVESYKKFLAASAGKFPEQESQARQRLTELHAR